VAEGAPAPEQGSGSTLADVLDVERDDPEYDGATS
jgi:hypothetical protein